MYQRRQVRESYRVSKGRSIYFLPKPLQSSHETFFSPWHLEQIFFGKPISSKLCFVFLALFKYPLSGASAKFRPLLAAVQCRASCEADVCDVGPTHRDVYARSSRPSLIAPPPRSLSRSRSAVL